MITTGSVRGKCSAPQPGTEAAIAAVAHLGGRSPQLGQKPMALDASPAAPWPGRQWRCRASGSTKAAARISLKRTARQWPVSLSPGRSHGEQGLIAPSSPRKMAASGAVPFSAPGQEPGAVLRPAKARFCQKGRNRLRLAPVPPARQRSAAAVAGPVQGIAGKGHGGCMRHQRLAFFDGKSYIPARKSAGAAARQPGQVGNEAAIPNLLRVAGFHLYPQHN